MYLMDCSNIERCQSDSWELKRQEKKYTNMWIVDNLSSIKFSNLCYKGSELLTQTHNF